MAEVSFESNVLDSIQILLSCISMSGASSEKKDFSCLLIAVLWPEQLLRLGAMLRQKKESDDKFDSRGLEIHTSFSYH